MPDDTMPGAFPAAPDDLDALDPSTLATILQNAIATGGGYLTALQRPRVETEGRHGVAGVTGP